VPHRHDHRLPDAAIFRHNIGSIMGRGKCLVTRKAPLDASKAADSVRAHDD
jgi:hypothetical protein